MRAGGSMSTVAEALDRLTAPGSLVQTLPGGEVRCLACGHRCLIRPGRRGICRVRFNQDGVLRVPWGYVAGLQCDPTEKKPFYHLLPGSDTLTFGMLGCDFHCSFCQNWLSSQTLRDPHSDVAAQAIRRISPEAIVEQGLRLGAQVVASSYNEPLITSEWALAIFERASAAGLHCAYVSNGNATPEVLQALRPYLTAFKVDLKTMQDRQYRRLGGVLAHVLESIQGAHALGLWVEVVTLVVPGFNDSTDELMEAARFLAGVSPDIPWHVTAFHPDYRLVDAPPTPPATLIRAAEIGQEAGLKFVYAGNLPGRSGDYEHTSCPSCGTRLIERLGFAVLTYHLSDAGACPTCGQSIPGVWGSSAAGVRTTSPHALFDRGPRVVR
jgi:pyruvate formate lyase activating enzyme